MTVEIHKESTTPSNLPPTPEVGQSPETEKVKEDTKRKLEDLKKDMTFDEFKRFLEDPEFKNMIPPENKQILLRSLLSVLNAKGYSIKLVQGRGIEIFGENMRVFNDKDKKELLKYDILFKSALKQKIFDIYDIQKAILFKSMSINDFQKWTVSIENMTTTDYFMIVLRKYGLTIKVDTEKGLKESDIGEYLKQLKFTDYKEFESFKNSQLSKITDIPDREFVRAYLDSLYYLNGENGYEENIQALQTQVDKNKGKISSIIQNLPEDIQVKLGLQKESIKDQFSMDPIGTLKKGAMEGGIMYAVVFGLLGKIFGRVFGIKHLGKLGLLVGGILGGGKALGRDMKDIEKLLSTFGSDHKDGKESTQQSLQESNDTPSTQTNVVDTHSNQFNTIYTKYESLFNGSEEQERLKFWKELSKNEKFLNAPSSFLNIFSTETDFEKQKREFKKYGIELTELNKEIYKIIFDRILKQRKSDGIGEPQQNETIRQFLERTSNTTNTILSGGVGKLQEDSSNNGRGTPFSLEQEQIIQKPEGMEEIVYLSRLLENGLIVSDIKPPELNTGYTTKSIFGKTFYIINPFGLTSDLLSYIMKGSFYAIGGGTIGLQNKGLEYLGRGTKYISDKFLSLISSEGYKSKITLQNQINNYRNSNLDTQEIQAKITELEGKIKEINEKILEFERLNGLEDVEGKEKLTKIQEEKEKLTKIQEEIRKEEKKFKEELLKLEEESKKLPSGKIKEELGVKLNTLVQEYNKKIIQLNTDYAIKLSTLPLEEQKIIVNDTTTQASKLASINGGLQNFLDKIGNNSTFKTGKSIFLTVGIISLLYNSRDGLGNIWKEGFSEKNKNDAIDMGIGIIPVVGGIWDLSVAIDGKDLNGRQLTQEERLVRAGFGVVGLIPGVGWIVKGLGKEVAGDLVVKTGVLSSGVLLAGVLGYSIKEAYSDIEIKL